MEKWQKEHIIENLAELSTLTSFNWTVKAELVANGILKQNTDIELLDAHEKQQGPSAASRLCYQMLMGRKGAYKVLYKALLEANQSGATSLLIRVPPEIFRKPLTYLGISTVVNEFKNVQLEVNGKTLKLHQFLPQVNYEMVQCIFYETIDQMEFYDSFITKEKKFVLAKNTIPPKPPNYIPRFLSNRVKLEESIFKVDCPDIFVFKNTLERYKLKNIASPHFTDSSSSQLFRITKGLKFIYLDEAEHWMDLKELAKAPIHLINFEADQNIFILEDSSVVSDILRKFVSKSARIYISEEEFIQQQISENCKASSVCICDTPGMGKTLLLANIARLMTEKCTGRIIAFIPLTMFTAEFSPSSKDSDFKYEKSLEYVIRYISTTSQKADLLLKLVRAKIVFLELFFDGFDEIPTEKIEWTKEVFKSISVEFPQVKMYITSRPHMRQELEEILGVIGNDILPFNQQNQTDFLVQFWSKNAPRLEHMSLSALDLLKAVNRSLTKKDKEISGIPLLCCLIAEVYSHKIAVSLNKKKTFDVIFKISKMYQEFIELRIKSVAIDEKEFDDIKMFHIWLALKTLFPTNDLHKNDQFKNVNKLLSSSEILKIGIVQQHLNSDMEFIHRTFAEYLVADYFANKLQEQETSIPQDICLNVALTFLGGCKNKQLHLTDHDYSFLYAVIVSFFDCILGDVLISDQAKSLVAISYFYISPEQLQTMLCACCQQKHYNIFHLLKEALCYFLKPNILPEHYIGLPFPEHTGNRVSNLVPEIFATENIYELLYVCIGMSTSQMFYSCVQLLTEVLQLDVSKIVPNDNRYTLLQKAVICVNYEAVEYLVDRVPLIGQDILKNCIQWSSINDEDIVKRENILQLLLNKDPTLINEFPDILVKETMHIILFKILVKYGADFTALSKNGDNCATKAAEFVRPKDYHEIVKFLVFDCKAEYLFVGNKKWEDPLPKIIKCSNIWPETLDLLLKVPGVDINMKDGNGENLLFSAVETNQFNIFHHLLKHGVDYNARGVKNRNLLHVCAEHAGLEMVRYLLTLKLCPNSSDENQWTPLHFATLHGRFSVVKVLVENGANVHTKNNKGQTALHLSADTLYPSIELIQYLIENGAGVNDRDIDGNTSLHLCKKEGVRDCLIKMGADVRAKNKMGQIPQEKNSYWWKYPSSE